MRLRDHLIRPGAPARDPVAAVECSMIACMDVLLYNGEHTSWSQFDDRVGPDCFRRERNGWSGEHPRNARNGISDRQSRGQWDGHG